MKFEITRDSLLNALSKVVGAVERTNTLPVLSNLLLDAQDSTLYVQATDMEVDIKASTDAEVDEPGRITVPARKLHDIVRALPSEDSVTLELKDEKVEVTAGQSQFSLTTLSADEFPATDEIESPSTVEVPATTLLAQIGRVAFAMAHNDVRHYLNGAFVEFRENAIRMVATDGHRLSFAESEVEHTAKPISAIAPRKAVGEFVRLLKASPESTARFSIGKNGFILEVADSRLTSRMIDGKYPDYEAVVPAVNGKAATVDRELLKSSVERVSLLSDQKSHMIRLLFDEGKVKLSARAAEMGEGADAIEAAHDYKKVETGFNASYLTDALGAFSDEEIRFQAKDSQTACLITSSTDTTLHKQVVMPLKV